MRSEQPGASATFQQETRRHAALKACEDAYELLLPFWDLNHCYSALKEIELYHRILKVLRFEHSHIANETPPYKDFGLPRKLTHQKSLDV